MAQHQLYQENGLILVGNIQLTFQNRISSNLIGMVDTGTWQTLMGCGVQEQLQLRTPNEIKNTAGLNGENKTSIFNGIDFHLSSNEVFQNIKIGSTGNSYYLLHGFHLIIGMDIISKGTLTINGPKNEFFLEFP